MEFPWWLVAWDRFAIASQAIPGQLTMQQAVLHKDVVINIACSAPAGGRTSLLGVLYDEIARSPFLFLRYFSVIAVLFEEMGGLVGEAWQEF